MQDDKSNIQKILRDDPDEAVEPLNNEQDTDDGDEQTAKRVIDLMANDSDDSDEIKNVTETEDIATDETQEVLETVDTVQDHDDSDQEETAEEPAEDAEESMTEETQETVASPEILKTLVQDQAQPEMEEAPVESLTAEQKKQRIMKVLVPLLMVAFVFMAKKSFFPSPGKAAAQKVIPAEIVESNTIPQWEIPDEYPSNLRDPMRFGSVTSGQFDVEEGSLLVKGIVFSSTPAAMVGGKIVKTGDEIMGATVVEIKKESVVFRSGNQQWEQKVKQ